MKTYPIAILIAALLGVHGLRKGSLSRSGAIGAFIAGYGHFANPLKVFGVTLIAFYLLGSRATKVRVDLKTKLEDGPDPRKPGGNRTFIQVFSNCLPSFLVALYYRFGIPSVDLAQSCPVTSNLSRPLIYTALAQLSTNFGDTLASELGILSSSPPRSILTLQSVPPGTNGGVSVYGLIMSGLGGGILGSIMVVDLLLESGGCRSGYGWVVEMMMFAIVSGLLGSLLDSILGATLQQTLYSTKDKRILTDHSHRTSSEPGLVKIGLGIDVLSNSGVNVTSGVIMAIAGWYWAST